MLPLRDGGTSDQVPGRTRVRTGDPKHSRRTASTSPPVACASPVAVALRGAQRHIDEVLAVLEPPPLAFGPSALVDDVEDGRGAAAQVVQLGGGAHHPRVEDERTRATTGRSCVCVCVCVVGWIAGWEE